MDIDNISRDKIRNDINTNFFVEAGAGSGKTSVLVDRMISMVEGGIDISKICAITFTKAAAGEFYRRFQKKLTESKSSNAKEALKNIDLCFMGTIDSFCNMVLSEHPAEARIPSNAIVSSNEELDTLYLRELSKIQRGDYGVNLQKKCNRFKEYFYSANDMFLAGLNSLMNAKNAEFNYIKPPTKEPDDIFKVERKKILSILEYLYNHPEALAQTSPKTAEKAYKTLMIEYPVLKNSWNENLGNIVYILKNLKDLRINNDYDITLLGPGYDEIFVAHETKNGAISWYEVASDEGDDPLAIQKIKNFQFAIAMDFISDSSKAISDTLRKEGKLSFNDYLLYLRDLLKEDASKDGKLINHIYNRHSYFLIDEFQDTNPLQAEVFFYLTAKKPETDWTKCFPKEGSLFIVGDPKQSIYRFRNADVQAFLNVKKLFTNPNVGEVLYLTRNFRSTDNMCAWFNKVFSDLLPTDTDIQCKFNPIPIGKKSKYEGTLEGPYKYDFRFTRSVSESDELNIVSNIINNLVNNPNITIQENGTTPRRPEYKDIMLITPTKSHLTNFMNKFIENDIPFSVEGKVLFNECPALYSISILMDAIADPFNSKKRFAAEKLSGLNIAETILFDYVKKSVQMSPASLFSLIMDEEKVFAKCGTDNIEYVYFALELLRSNETSGDVTSIQDGAKYISALVNNDSDEERCIQLVKDNNRIRIANLHKVKGLEAPIVILADPRRNAKEATSRVDYSVIPPKSYLFELDTSTKTADFSKEKELEEKVLAAELDRLIYVAATRAESVIIVSDVLDSKGNSKDNNPWYPLLKFADEDIMQKIEASFTFEPKEKEVLKAEELYGEAEDTAALNDRTSEESSYHIERPSQIKLKSVTSNEDDYEDSGVETAPKSSSKHNAALIGTIVHRLMEILVSSNGNAKLNDTIQEIVKEYDADTKYYRDILFNVGETIIGGGYNQVHGAPNDILAELLFADEVYTEVPFCYDSVNSNIINGVMDAIYLKDDKWHIIDYKTDDEIDPEGIKHQAQLEAYIEAFKELTGNTADAKIYHIEI